MPLTRGYKRDIDLHNRCPPDPQPDQRVPCASIGLRQCEDEEDTWRRLGVPVTSSCFGTPQLAWPSSAGASAMGPMLPEGFYVAGWRIGARRTDIDDECLIAVPTSHHGAKSVQRRRSSFKLSGTLSVLSLLLTEKDGGVVLLTYLRTTGR